MSQHCNRCDYLNGGRDCPGIESAGGEVVAWGCEECGWSAMIVGQTADWQSIHDNQYGQMKCDAPVIPLGKLGGECHAASTPVAQTAGGGHSGCCWCCDAPGHHSTRRQCGPGIESAGGEVVAWLCVECDWLQQSGIHPNGAQAHHDSDADRQVAFRACRATVVPLGKLVKS